MRTRASDATSISGEPCFGITAESGRRQYRRQHRRQGWRHTAHPRTVSFLLVDEGPPLRPAPAFSQALRVRSAAAAARVSERSTVLCPDVEQAHAAIRVVASFASVYEKHVCANRYNTRTNM